MARIFRIDCTFEFYSASSLTHRIANDLDWTREILERQFIDGEQHVSLTQSKPALPFNENRRFAASDSEHDVDTEREVLFIEPSEEPEELSSPEMAHSDLDIASDDGNPPRLRSFSPIEDSADESNDELFNLKVAKAKARTTNICEPKVAKRRVNNATIDLTDIFDDLGYVSPVAEAEQDIIDMPDILAVDSDFDHGNFDHGTLGNFNFEEFIEELVPEVVEETVEQIEDNPVVTLPTFEHVEAEIQPDLMPVLPPFETMKQQLQEIWELVLAEVRLRPYLS